MLRSDEILLDDDAISGALRSPRTPHFSGIPGKYRLEDRLPAAGPRGTVRPPSPRVLEAMSPTFPARQSSSSRTVLLGLALLVVASVAGLVVYRDTHPTPPAETAAPSIAN